MPKVKNILVVGGAGYIGSHMSKMLTSKNYNVTILDDLSTGHKKAARYGRFIEGSASDSTLVAGILKENSIDVVMHFAAKALVPESVANPLLYYVSNTADTIRLIEVMLKCGVNNFVFSSTCATFGEPKTVPIHENVEQTPVNPYGASKLMVELAVRDICKKNGLNAAVLRYFNAAGADESGEIGEDHKIETHLIPLAVAATLGNNKNFRVFGNDYPTPDGSCIRDYIHVNDLAEAHILAMNYMIEKGGYHDFNLGTENGASVFEILAAIKKVTGTEVPYTIAQRREGDPPKLIGDSRKAHELLNWTAKYSLEKIIETAVNWHKKNPRGFA